MLFSCSTKTYIAIIGDLKNSKGIQKRWQIQEELKRVLDSINEKYSSHIESKFIITLGDEFQGLLCNGGSVIPIILEIERKMYPIKIRFGIGIGEITTKINPDMAIGADGPAYYAGRMAINHLKENEKKKQVGPSDIRVEIHSKKQEISMMINTILSLLTTIKSTWSNRQREIIWNILEHNDSQKNVGERLNIKQPTVQTALSSGKYYSYKEGLDTLNKILKEIGEEDV